MMQCHEKKTLERLFDDGGAILENLQFRKCLFKSCSLAIKSGDSCPRTIVRGITLTDCELWACRSGAAIMEDVVIQSLKTNGPLQFFGAAFRHVLFRRKIERIMLSSLLRPGLVTDLQQKNMDELNEEFYRNVDWSLDIREAEFLEFDVSRSRIPATLFVRDPATQAVLTRAKAAQGTWRTVDLTGTYWRTTIELFLEHGAADTVLVAPKRARNFKKYIEGLRRLREAGVVEPD